MTMYVAGSMLDVSVGWLGLTLQAVFGVLKYQNAKWNECKRCCATNMIVTVPVATLRKAVQLQPPDHYKCIDAAEKDNNDGEERRVDCAVCVGSV